MQPENGPNQFVHQMKNNLGLIAERIAPLATSSTDWKLIQKTDLRPYFKAGEDLVDYVMSIAHACRPQCDPDGLYEEAKVAARQAERVLDLIFTNGEDKEHRRERRALVPFVGSIHKFLWGTLTEADEAEMQAAIRAIAEDTRNTAALLANQTEIVDRELSDINSRMLKLKVATDILFNKTVENSNALAAQNAVQNAKASISQFRLDTEVITDAILFAAKGLIHPRIFPPETLSKAAKTVESTVANAKFPLPASEFAAIPIMKISRIAIVLSNGHLVYQVAIPLLDIEKFNLYKATPIPSVQPIMNVSSVAAYIWPEHHYFAVSMSNRTYMPLPAENVPKLRQLGALLIAINPEPVREIQENAACEVKVASGRKIADPSVCDVRIKQLRDTFWLRLFRANTWIYATRAPEDIFIQCLRAEQIATRISGAGVLELHQGCSAHTGSARLTASRALTTHLNITSFDTVHFNLSKILASLNNSASTEADFQQAIASEAAYRAQSLHGTELENLKAGAGLREIASKAREISRRKATAFELKYLGDFTSILGYSSWSMIGGLAIAIGLIWCFIRHRAGKPMRDIMKQQKSLMQLEMAREIRRNRAETSV